MMIAIFPYFFWLLYSPINVLAGGVLGVVPPIHIIVIDTVVYIPIIGTLIRVWLQNMMKRTGGPAAGIDVVEPGGGEPEEGDELGVATRPYSEKNPPKIAGSKSDLREAPHLTRDFFVKTPDIETGMPLFDIEALRARAMMKSRVSSGGWIRKRVATRGSGSLKASESSTVGRPLRSRVPLGKVSSIHIPATVMAAIARLGGRREDGRIKILPVDLREKVFTAKTPLTVILVIDVSLSMKGSMKQVRKVVERIERETRGSRDRIGIIAFKDSGAIEVQAPTSNWNKLYRALARLRISGLSPLADGLMKAIETLKREQMRNRDVEALVVMLSDFSANIPLAQFAGPGHQQYTPVRDLIRAARMARSQKIRLVTVNFRADQKHWVRLLKLPYHDAVDLATTLRMKKEGYHDQIETILAVPTFRETFGAFLVAKLANGRSYLPEEVLKTSSVLGEFLAACQRRSKLKPEALENPEAYLR
ncbi:MAG: vWA domain-containing protein [Candidatus Thorarchaeota archaeon]